MKRHRRDDAINIKCGSNNVGNNESRALLQLRLPLFFSFWFLVFLFYSELGLTRGNGGNFLAGNKNMTNSSVCDNKPCNSEGSEFGDGNKSDYVNGVVLKFNVSVASNGSDVHDYLHTNSGYSLRGTSELEEAVWIFLGHPTLVCGIQPQEQRKQKAVEQLKIGKNHSSYLNLDEFRNITKQKSAVVATTRLDNITHRLEPDGTEYNYASAAKGAKVVAHNKEAKGASNILGKDHDKYLRNPCSVGGKFVVIELAEETLVDAVKIANFEHYSSNFKEFELSGSLVYPTESWSPIGKFVAANVKHTQTFKLPEPKWVRYLKLNLFSHYGSEFYCTLSVVEVYGIDAIERMLEDFIVAAGEPATNKLPHLNSTAMPSLLLDPGSGNKKMVGEVQSVIEAASKGIEGINEGQKPNTDALKNPTGHIPDPVTGVRQPSNGRIHADAVLKILMQKVRSLEINLSVLEEYIKELNRREGDLLPELEKELSRYSMLLEKSKGDVKDLLEWKEIMEKGVTDIESWKTIVSSRMDALARENSMLRLDIEKIVKDQVSLENEEIALLLVSVCFGLLAIIKLVSERVLINYGASPSGEVRRASRGWILMLVSTGLRGPAVRRNSRADRHVCHLQCREKTE
ncbi:SUN domain-containing protein 5 [Diospyros lotus]|uniref:SUN domain-containing protein 5 n=1 Tax=Diospyros lotus TaxID=55363 RepID=UPI00225528F2|nr:SUN domain-containing protein 5 [Diospyros lotus]XP_052210550.1 SUN domain-containing protein 5 [Diospyros lotus]